MLNFSFSDLASLSSGQREALSGFILSFHSPFEIESAPKKTRVEPVAVASEESELTPEATFGSDDTFKSITGAPAAAQATSGLDKSGLPWDERIHSSSKAFNADGTWRKKRGVSDALVAEAEAQLKQLMSIPAPAPGALPSDPIPAVPAPPAEVVSFPVASPVPLPPDFDGKTAFVNFIKRVSESVLAKKITQQEVTDICAKHGVPGLPLLANRLDLVPMIATEVEALVITR